MFLTEHITDIHVGVSKSVCSLSKSNNVLNKIGIHIYHRTYFNSLYFIPEKNNPHLKETYCMRVQLPFPYIQIYTKLLTCNCLSFCPQLFLDDEACENMHVYCLMDFCRQNFYFHDFCEAKTTLSQIITVLV